MLILPKDGATIRQISEIVNQLIQGGGNMVGTVTLTPGVTSTTVSKPTVNANARVFLEPMTANAAAARATTYSTVTPGGGSFTIVHANAGSSDRTFAYEVKGS